MTGYKRGNAGTQQLERAIRWMRTLNNDAADVLRGLEPSAVTDVTGFGLFGHAHEVADRSGVRVRLESERFPAIDGALDVARHGVRTSGDPRNRDFAGAAPRARTACPRRSSRSATTRRPPAACSSRSRPSGRPRSRPSSRRASSSSAASGRVEEGAGVVVE